MNIEFNTALLCDQIRQEMNGKYILIGIYSSSIVFSDFPNISHFNLFARVTMNEMGDHKMSLRVLIDGVENHRILGGVIVEKHSVDWLPIALQPIQFVVPCRLSVEQMRDDGSWNEFFDIQVARPDPV